MFVFPAFDSNYKTRKRTFRCCKKCRTKRIRCIILNSDYDVYGCDNCRLRGLTCDLAKPSKVKMEQMEPDFALPVVLAEGSDAAGSVDSDPHSGVPSVTSRPASGPSSHAGSTISHVSRPGSTTSNPGRAGHIVNNGHNGNNGHATNNGSVGSASRAGSFSGDPPPALTATHGQHHHPVLTHHEASHTHYTHEASKYHMHSHSDIQSQIEALVDSDVRGQTLLSSLAEVAERLSKEPFILELMENMGMGNIVGNTMPGSVQGSIPPSIPASIPPSISESIPSSLPPSIPGSLSGSMPTDHMGHDPYNLGNTPTKNTANNTLRKHTLSEGSGHSGVDNNSTRDSLGSSDSWQFTPPFPPTVPGAPYVASIESIDAIIHRIDWKYLKKHYDFNTTMRQPRFYFSKTVSRKENSPQQVETVTEVLSKKHYIKTKKLSPRNALHFKFLLSMHAFTLNTPGFYEISETDLLQLFEIYFYKINSVFPIVFEQEFWELYKRNKIPTIIIYAIVLITARDELAEPILARSFVNNGASFRANQIRFLTDLEMKIRQVLMFLPELGDTEKLARLITQLLLSLNFNFNKFGNEQSSHDLAECISYAYSLLIHQEFFHVRIAKEGAQKKSIYLKHLWWVIFTFDRFNGLMNGKAMFIKRLDFNISRPTDLPHLDKLVGLAYSLEDTLIAVFRPPRRIGNTEVIAKMDTLEGDPEFRPGQFIEQGMEVVKDLEELKAQFSKYRQFETAQKGHLPGIPVEEYRDRMVLFLSRILNNQIVLILRTGQVKYSNDTPDMDEFSLNLSESFLSLLDMLRDGRGSQLMMETPLIPLIALVAFSVPLTTRLRIISKLKSIENMAIDIKKLQKVGELSLIYLRELKKFAEKWWFVNEVVASINNLNLKVNNIDKVVTQQAKRKNSEVDEPKVKRERLSIHSLVTGATDVETVLPPLLSITSPGFYDEVITKNESDDDDEVSSDELLEGNDHLDSLVNMKVLVPPMIGNYSMPAFATAEDLAYRAQEIRNMASTGDIMNDAAVPGPYFSSRDSITSDDIHFDIDHLAELVNNETSFVPSIMDFFNEHELSI